MTQSTKFSFFEYTPEIQQEWDDFVIENPYGSVHQISQWKTFQSHIPGRGYVLGYGLRDTSTQKIIGTCWCVKMSTGIGNSFWWYSARGPVIDPTNTEATAFFLDAIKEKLNETKGIFWRIDPYFSKINYASMPLEWKPATQNYQPEHTLILDLTKDNETLLAEMKRKGRYNIKQAIKHDVKVRMITGKNLSTKDLYLFWNLNTETTERDKFSGHNREYYQKFLRDLDPKSVLFLAERDGVALAGAINTHVGTKAIYYFGASTSDNSLRKYMAPYLLQWEMIQYAKTQGCTSYDFLGIAPEGEPNHPYAGISEFKWKFGGTRNVYAPGKEFSLRPLFYKAYRILKKVKW